MKYFSETEKNTSQSASSREMVVKDVYCKVLTEMDFESIALEALHSSPVTERVPAPPSNHEMLSQC